ncbi:MAG: S8 family serine peptidase [Pirellulaceae bacterium]
MQRRFWVVMVVMAGVFTFPSYRAETEAQEAAFDGSALQPHVETGAERFLKTHSDYDGRGVVVAIFDTGVDPGAPGLAQTPQGKPKIIDMVDGTGSGDVKTSTLRKAEDGKVIGLTGRSLRLHPDWLKGSQQFHVGKKPAFELFPAELLPRLKRARREKRDLQIEQLKTKLRLRSQQLANAKSDAKKAEKKDVDARINALDGLAGAEDLGPIYDCVVFMLDKKWRAVVDTDEDGDLRDEVALTNFRDEHQYGTFGSESGMNFGVNIYDQGKLLSIVADTGDHGTHVAGIVGAYFPDQPDLNGVAPGVQIVSVKIGDTRIGGMETAPGLVRGLIAAKRAGCDLINMSYGEPSRTPNRGRIPEHFADFINKHGIIYISSAGNAGPALSTVGAPGATLSASIGVGAYISPAMMRSEYVLDGKLPEMPYTWTSRGPAYDGDMGVDIFAPGGAFSPVPNWTRQKVLQMNGTSMASPNTCGSVALLISGLKQLSVPYNVQSIRRALANTAREIPDIEVFAQGPGLLQVDRAFDYLREHADATAEQLNIRVMASGNRRGIYLREQLDTAEPSSHLVNIRPIFPDDAKNAERVDFELRLSLSTTADWVSTGNTVLLTHGGQNFRVRVDASDLEPGVHTSWVIGHDAEAPDRGPLVRLPVTLIVPEKLSDVAELEESVELAPGVFHRTFIQVPPGAQWADFQLQRQGGDVPARFVVHAVQKLDDRNFRDAEFQAYITLKPDEKTTRSFAVTGGRVLEFCVCQYWSTPGEHSVDFTLRFRGIVPSDRNVTLIEGTPGLRVDLTNHLPMAELDVKARLTTHRHAIAAKTNDLRPSPSVRDRLPDGRVIHRLRLSYLLEQTKDGNVTLRFPATDDWLYDSPFGGHLWTVHDQHGRLVYTDDIWSDPVKLSKGKYTITFTIRHENTDKLRDLKSMSMVVDRPLSSPISVTTSNAQWSKGASLPGSLGHSSMTTAFFHTPSKPPMAVAGDQLLGTVTYAGKPAADVGSAGRPGGFKLAMLVTTGSRSTSKPTPTKPEGELAVAVQHLHALDREENRKKQLAKVVTAADKVIDMIEQDEVAMHFGRRIDTGDAAAVKERKAFEKQRSHLIDALYRKGRALAYMELPEVIAKKPIADLEEHEKRFEANYTLLSQWVDPTEKDHFLLAVRRHRRKGELGAALVLLQKQMKLTPANYWHYKKQRDMMVELGWSQLAKRATSNLMVRFPEKTDK